MADEVAAIIEPKCKSVVYGEKKIERSREMQDKVREQRLLTI